MKLKAYNLGGLNLKISPFLHEAGELIRSVNVENDVFGGKSKRPGYATYLGTPDNDQVNTLFDWHQNDGTFWNYRASGSVLYYSTQGTGDWTTCGNGTITDGNSVGHAVLEDTLVVGDGALATRHSTDGTSFTDTTLAPVANYFEEFNQRMWAGGTANDLFYSTTGTATDWSTDSSSIRIPGEGKINSVFKSANRLMASLDSGRMFRYDGYNLTDLATDLGPTSSNSIANVEDFRFYLNRLGVFGYGGVKPELISNPVEKQIYNDKGEGIAGTIFDTAPGVAHKYNYYLAAGTVTDNLTDETLPRCVLVHDYQHNEWGNYNFATLPTALHSYKDENGALQMIFGDSGGQCYTFGGTATLDNTTAITSVLEGMLHFGAPELDKKFNYIWAFFNPGTQAKMQIAIVDTFTKGKKKWISLGDCSDGVAEFKFPADSRGKLLFWKVSESSRNARFNFYGFTVDADLIERR